MSWGLIRAIWLQDAVAAEPTARPGLKAIHLRASVLNPNKAGDFPVILTFENAGELTGSRRNGPLGDRTYRSEAAGASSRK
jgi:hypothetical protein